LRILERAGKHSEVPVEGHNENKMTYCPFRELGILRAVPQEAQIKTLYQPFSMTQMEERQSHSGYPADMETSSSSSTRTFNLNGWTGKQNQYQALQ
jgi:hypothetical protein